VVPPQSVRTRDRGRAKPLRPAQTSRTRPFGAGCACAHVRRRLLVVPSLAIVIVAFPQQFGAGAKRILPPSARMTRPTARRCTCNPNRLTPVRVFGGPRNARPPFSAPTQEEFAAGTRFGASPRRTAFRNGNGSSNPRPSRSSLFPTRRRLTECRPLGVFTVMEGVTRKPYSDSSATEGRWLRTRPTPILHSDRRHSVGRGRPGRQRRYRCRRRC
jgi:hypothetical protein